jgi:hypothetical protein
MFLTVTALPLAASISTPRHRGITVLCYPSQASGKADGATSI